MKSPALSDRGFEDGRRGVGAGDDSREQERIREARRFQLGMIKEGALRVLMVVGEPVALDIR